VLLTAYAAGMADVYRRAARVLIIDAESRVLLLRGIDPARPQTGFWHAPGGGIDEGETDAVAAVREVREETGIDVEVDSAPVWKRHLNFSFDGIRYDQHEVYFVARVSAPEVNTSGRSATENRYLGAHRWFSVDDLRDEADLLAPPDLADRFDDLLRLGLPSEPVMVAGAVFP
jgi:8-oxo-dGTP pyrophosphatase MutT (NUDIX family)